MARKKGGESRRSAIVKFYQEDPERRPCHAVKTFGITSGYASRLRRQALSQTAKRPAQTSYAAMPKRREKAQLMLRLSSSLDAMSLIVYDSRDVMQGTLLVSGQGVSYKRPNQKLGVAKFLPWTVLSSMLEVCGQPQKD